MAEETEKGQEETPETPETLPADPDEAILAKYGGDPKKVAAAYRNLQSTYTKTQAVEKRFQRVVEQLTGAGYTLGDDDTIYTPPAAKTGAKPKPEEEEEEEEELDPAAAKRIAALEARLQSAEQVVGSVTMSLADGAKKTAFQYVAEEARPPLEAEFQKVWSSLPLGMRTAQNADTLAKKLAMDAIVEGKGRNAPKGRSEGESAILESLAGAADGTKGEARGGNVPATADMRQMYDVLGLKETGMTFEEYAKQATEAMR